MDEQSDTFLTLAGYADRIEEHTEIALREWFAPFPDIQHLASTPERVTFTSTPTRRFPAAPTRRVVIAFTVTVEEVSE